MLNIQTVIAFTAVGAVSYLLGSLNFALLISRFVVKDDIRRHGSGNAGMTNILRTYGKKAAVATAAGDFLKAIIAITFSRWMFGFLGVSVMDAGYLAGLMVMIGHMYPLYFHFRGGKGVMTCFAVILAINPWVFLILALVFIPLVMVTRIVSLGSVLGAAAFPFLICGAGLIQGQSIVYDAVFSIVISSIILYKHKDNIRRLLSGTENRFGSKKK